MQLHELERRKVCMRLHVLERRKVSCGCMSFSVERYGIERCDEHC